MLGEGGHNHGEDCRVLTDDLGLLTIKNELLECCLEIKKTLFICELLQNMLLVSKHKFMCNG